MNADELYKEIQVDVDEAFKKVEPILIARAARERYLARHGHYPNHHPPMIKQKVKVGRNSPCPCGSGKKNKKCCKQ